MEKILVGVVVVAALIWAVRAIWRSVRGGGVCGDCSSSGDCPAAGKPQELHDLGGSCDSPPSDLRDLRKPN